MDVVSVTSPVGFWRAFLKLKVGGACRRHLGSASDNQNWAKMRAELVAKTTPTKRDSGDSSGNPPVTQVATPLIMQSFKV